MLNQLLFPVAKRFVSGQTIQEVLPAVRRLNASGIVTTLDVLGENVSDRRAADAAVVAYLETLDWIQREGLSSNVSLKLTQMGLDIGSDYCLRNVARICERAAAGNNFVRIDMEGSAYTERTLNLFYELFQKHQNVGVVIQAYLHRSEQDVQQADRTRGPSSALQRRLQGTSQPGGANNGGGRKNFMSLASLLLSQGTIPRLRLTTTC